MPGAADQYIIAAAADQFVGQFISGKRVIMIAAARVLYAGAKSDDDVITGGEARIIARVEVQRNACRVALCIQKVGAAMGIPDHFGRLRRRSGVAGAVGIVLSRAPAILQREDVIQLQGIRFHPEIRVHVIGHDGPFVAVEVRVDPWGALKRVLEGQRVPQLMQDQSWRGRQVDSDVKYGKAVIIPKLPAVAAIIACGGVAKSAVPRDAGCQIDLANIEIGIGPSADLDEGSIQDRFHMGHRRAHGGLLSAGKGGPA